MEPVTGVILLRCRATRLVDEDGTDAFDVLPEQLLIVG